MVSTGKGFCMFLMLPLCGWMLANADTGFDENYYVSWGFDHALCTNDGKEMQIYMDKSSGAGFKSVRWFGSGIFHMRIKLPMRDCAGVVTSFYLTTEGDHHDEMDFEFLGNREGKPVVLQTNVITNGYASREQRVLLWFDPTTDFHDYKIDWNQHQIVFYVDDTPIRVYKNNENIGVPYPSRPMIIDASIWDGSNWATDGGQTKIDWNHAPFRAYFQGFDISSGCTVDKSKSIHVKECYASTYSWNHQDYWQLNSTEQLAYEKVRREQMNYDYCTDSTRFPRPPSECSSNT